MMDSTPIVVIAGQVGIGALGSDAFQEVDLVGVAQPICKWAYQIRRPEDIAWAVSRAFYIAKSGRPGPVVLDLPKNTQTDTCEWQPAKTTNVRSYDPYPTLDAQTIEAAAQLINGAKRPFALVGQGVELGNAHEELLAFLEKADSSCRQNAARFVGPCIPSSLEYGYVGYALELCNEYENAGM